VNDVVNGMNAMLGLIGKLASDGSDTSVDVVRGILGVLDVVTGVPILPIFNTIVSILYRPLPKPNPVLVKLDQIRCLLGDVKSEIHNLADKLRTVVRIELNMQRLQEYSSVIDCVI